MNRNNVLFQFVQYFFVGLLATIVEWMGFYSFNELLGLNYLLATALAFFFSTFANWGFGRLIMFKGTGNLVKEILKIYVVSIMGLIMNLVIMYVLVDAFLFKEMISKIITTGIVFVWNFLIRKLLVYKSS